MRILAIGSSVRVDQGSITSSVVCRRRSDDNRRARRLSVIRQIDGVRRKRRLVPAAGNRDGLVSLLHATRLFAEPCSAINPPVDTLADEMVDA